MPTTVVENIRPELKRFAVPIDSITPHPKNARRGNVEGIASSLERFGQMRPVIVQKSTGYIIAGNHTTLGARHLGWSKIAAYKLDVDDETALSYLIADNRWSDLASYDDAGQLAVLRELEASGLLEGTGYSDDDLDELQKLLDDVNAMPDNENKGEALQALDVSIAEPRTKLQPGAIVKLDQHTLVVADVYVGWPVWQKFLSQGVIFVPYPTPTLPMTERARESKLLLVQPDTYLAGHLVDKYESVFGSDGVSFE